MLSTRRSARKAFIAIESSTMPRYVACCSGCSVVGTRQLFAQLTWRSSLVMCAKRCEVSWTTWYWEFAHTSQSSMYGSTLTPLAWTGAKAAATHQVKTQGDREIPKGSILN